MICWVMRGIAGTDDRIGGQTARPEMEGGLKRFSGDALQRLKMVGRKSVSDKLGDHMPVIQNVLQGRAHIRVELPILLIVLHGLLPHSPGET